jgi:hypothetical protein
MKSVGVWSLVVTSPSLHLTPSCLYFDSLQRVNYSKCARICRVLCVKLVGSFSIEYTHITLKNLFVTRHISIYH